MALVCGSPASRRPTTGSNTAGRTEPARRSRWRPVSCCCTICCTTRWRARRGLKGSFYGILEQDRRLRGADGRRRRGAGRRDRDHRAGGWRAGRGVGRGRARRRGVRRPGDRIPRTLRRACAALVHAGLHRRRPRADAPADGPLERGAFGRSDGTDFRTLAPPPEGRGWGGGLFRRELARGETRQPILREASGFESPPPLAPPLEGEGNWSNPPAPAPAVRRRLLRARMAWSRSGPGAGRRTRMRACRPSAPP